MTDRRAVQLDFDEPPVYEDAGSGFPGSSPRSAVTVSSITGAAKDLIEGAVPPIWVRGEVSDFKAHRSGHWYFSLRDRTSQLRAVIWARDVRGIPAPPDEGMQVCAYGRLTVYQARGEMQFSITRLEAKGDGLRQKALEITRQRLEADGLLAPERKRRLPVFPRTVAVITSPDGAALRDIVAVVKRRGMGVRVVVVPAAVQGDSAPEELCYALDQVARWKGADVVIIGRGGGAREDLWAFNNERVARALAKCPIPTISAVGHEIDMTICDLVADHRAPTPSAAAEVATRSRDELAAMVRQLGHRLRRNVESTVSGAGARLRGQGRSLARAGASMVERREARVQSLAGRLDALSPLTTLARGYAIPRGDDGRTLSLTTDFAEGDEFDLVIRDGTIRSRVVDVAPADPERRRP